MWTLRLLNLQVQTWEDSLGACPPIIETGAAPPQKKEIKMRIFENNETT